MAEFLEGLSWIAAGMLVSDVFVVRRFGELDGLVKVAAEAAGALVAIGVGYWLTSGKSAAVAGREEGESARG